MSTIEPDLRISVRLMVLNFPDDPGEISKTLGMEPTETWSVGDKVAPISTHRHKQNGWVVASPADPNSTTSEAAVQALLSSLPEPAAFRRLPSACEVQLSIGLIGYRQRPGVFLSKDSLNTLATMGASLDVDPYDLTEND